MRLAVIYNSRTADAGDLLTAALSKIDGVEMLERAEIDRVLDEQKMSADLITDAESQLKVGALLGADGVVLVTAHDDKQFECRFVSVGQGVVLADNHHQLQLPPGTMGLVTPLN